MFEAIKRIFRSRAEKHADRMLHSDFQGLEATLEFELPNALKQAYADPAFILREFFQIRGNDHQVWQFQGFLPADPGTLWYARTAKVEGFPFATNVEGEIYYLTRPGEDTRSPVLLRKFSGEDLPVAESFEEFLSFLIDDIDDGESDT